ncbi:subtilisin-like protease SBT5.6 [Malania oleifera]|uniref:subtilisin-like protease SBT5.6 n=1 Tax=Malania oleifera TaxID=397392 RepID=UPI0025AE52B8|nr:subtilisin-like protease SBT5.6 [Malania oleifera]
MKGVPLIFFLLLFLLPFTASSMKKQVYVVYLGEHAREKPVPEIEDTYRSYLFSVKRTEEEARASLIYSYKNINGFAAHLTPIEASNLSEMEEVVSVFRSHPRKYALHTTRSWEFLGLYIDEGAQSPCLLQRRGCNLRHKARNGQDMIIGLLDTGVWPESQSFNDEGMPPIPNSWNGTCQSGVAFNSSNCNKKLIGARYYLNGYEAHYGVGALNATTDGASPRDWQGHGTHTASTAAGREVPNASAIGGFGYGVASGGAPLARLAIYKVCWLVPSNQMEHDQSSICFDEDMLAAIDDAITDGVHVLSISIGSNVPLPYSKDGIAIGSLHAVKHNIVTVASAGNFGPNTSSVSNAAPWILTVGANSIDRAFLSPVVLGDGKRIMGQSITPYGLKNDQYSLVYGAGIAMSSELYRQCLPGSLSKEKAKGKIVFCNRGVIDKILKCKEAKRAQAAAFILGNDAANGNGLLLDTNFIPSSAVTFKDTIKILNYINSTKNPTATIVYPTTVFYNNTEIFMATFSGKGPHALYPNFLKPEITAPGLHILAAWSEGTSPTDLPDDDRVVPYNIISGTSVSCPHVAGVAALLKAVHQNWSSAAIRSALITTSKTTNSAGLPIMDAFGNLADPYLCGAGLLQPEKAADPGLVYDASYTDYLLYLCSIGLENIDPSFKCPEATPRELNNLLNCPSLVLPKLNGTMTVNRTVTNVGGAKSVYIASVMPPSGFVVEVWPSMLVFDHVGQKKSFIITVRTNSQKKGGQNDDQYAFGWYAWADGLHWVKSPIVVSLT